MTLMRRKFLQLGLVATGAMAVSACGRQHGIRSGGALESTAYQTLASAADAADVVVRGTASVAKLAYVFHVEEEDDDLPIVGVWIPDPRIASGSLEPRFRNELTVAFFGCSGSTDDTPLGSDTADDLTNLLVGLDALYFLRWGGSLRLDPLSVRNTTRTISVSSPMRPA